MGKTRDAPKKEPSPNYVLCQMPPGWTTLPLKAGFQPPPPHDSVAVYTKNSLNQELIYKGFICPVAPQQLPITMLQAPPKPQRGKRLSQKFKILQEGIRAKDAEAAAAAKAEAEAEAAAKAKCKAKVKAEAEAKVQARKVSEDQKSSEADSAWSSKPGECAVNAKPSIMSVRKDTADESKPQIKEEAVFNSESDSNSNYPLPFEILESGESFLPAFVWDDLWETSFDMDFLNSFNVKEEPPSNSRADTCQSIGNPSFK